MDVVTNFALASSLNLLLFSIQQLSQTNASAWASGRFWPEAALRVMPRSSTGVANFTPESQAHPGAQYREPSYPNWRLDFAAELDAAGFD